MAQSMNVSAIHTNVRDALQILDNFHEMNYATGKKTWFIAAGVILTIVLLLCYKHVVQIERERKMYSDIETISTCLKRYQKRYGSLPNASEGLNALLGDPKEHLPFIDRLPYDPWKRSYNYETADGKTLFRVSCTTPDGVIVARDTNLASDNSLSE